MGITFDTNYEAIKSAILEEYKWKKIDVYEAKALLDRARNYRVVAASDAIHELRRQVYGDPFKANGGIMSRDLIAYHLGLSDNEADEYISDWLYFGFTERQGGGIVV